ncbi:MAG TPA: aldo/keto reductase, partial [Bacillota bacterium]|nr:aldo/keto reductase [Bacillota bacterium]
ALQQGGYRHKTWVATKFPAYKMVYHRYDELKANPAVVVERIIDEQLRKLRTDCIEMYLIHNLEKRRWPALQAVGMLDILQTMQAKGKIRYIGFSFHDSYELFTQIIDAFAWDMCQIQLNILDQEFQAGVAGLQYAGSKGIPVTIMEPLRGGSLVQNIPEEIQKLWDHYEPHRSVVDWCFRWVCNFPEVMTVLSGVSTMGQTHQNVQLFDTMLPNSMTPAELELVCQVREQYQKRIKVTCTNCGYCLPCPAGVQIPKIFQTYNNTSMFNNRYRGRKEYTAFQANQTDASRCVRCGKCESHCPQGIPVMEQLRQASAFLTE